MPRDGIDFAAWQGARKERWLSIVTDEQRSRAAKAIRREAVVLGEALKGVAALARAISPRCAPLLLSASPKTIPRHPPQ